MQWCLPRPIFSPVPPRNHYLETGHVQAGTSLVANTASQDGARGLHSAARVHAHLATFQAQTTVSQPPNRRGWQYPVEVLALVVTVQAERTA